MDLRKPLINMSDYSPAARLYWCATTLFGAVVLAWAIYGTLRLDNNVLLGVVALLAVTVVAGLRPIRIPGTRTSATPGDIFVFLAALLWGSPVAVLVAATDVAAGAYRSSRRWTSRIGSPALMSITALLSTETFLLAQATLRDHRRLNTATMLMALLGFSLFHFLLNSLLTWVLDALKQRRQGFYVWWRSYSWMSLTSLASASTAGLIYLTITQHGISSLVAAAPLVGIVFATCHFYFKQADEREKAIEGISRVHLATVEALATAINAKDEITHDHVYRVRVYATGLARHFGLSDLEIEALKAGALLHDVGKIAVPDYILNKPGKLTAAEFEKMKIHTVVGAQIMERVNFPYPVVPIVRHHHERWDGTGYPDALAGAQIPLTARILSVVDAFDAVSEDRQYRKGMTRDEACGFLRSNSGTQFDPSVVEAFLLNLPKYEEEIAAHKTSHHVAFSPSQQAGISEVGARAVPAAGLAQPAVEAPEYVKQIHASHVEVAALHEMAQTFSAQLDVSDVVALTASRIERMIPFTTCVFYLRRDRDDSATAAYAFGRNADQIRGKSLAAGRGIAGWVMINGRPMSNTDAMLDLTELVGGQAEGYRIAAVYPLKNGEVTIGALALYSGELDSYNGGHLHLIESVARLASTALQHAMLNEQTKASNRTDALTGLPTGPALYARIDQEAASAITSGQPLSAVSLRLVGLRLVNESHGYQVGDKVLFEAARVLRLLIGHAALLGRIAGDEFICILPNCDRDEAVQLAEAARGEIDQLSVETRPGERAGVSLRFAVTQYIAGQTVDDLLHALARAGRRATSRGLNPADPSPASSAMVS
jgi:diguanylate cyclase (GGDEF)-like protein/putative nucleotidyltransferase with HDIG domain